MHDYYSELSLVLCKLKQILKDSRINYSQLAEGLSLSEASIKRIFTSKDISFRRLNEICDFLGVTLSDILKSIEDEQVYEVSFPNFVEQLFIEKPIQLSIYWKLVIERKPLDLLRNQLNLSEKKLFICLKELDNLRLIELHPHGKVKLPSLSPVKWAKTRSKLQDIVCLQWGKKIVSDAYYSKLNEHDVSVHFFQITPGNLESLQKRLGEIEDEYARKTIHDMKIHPKELLPVRYVRSMAKGSFLD